jgi:hypothetical protein
MQELIIATQMILGAAHGAHPPASI